MYNTARQWGRVDGVKTAAKIPERGITLQRRAKESKKEKKGNQEIREREIRQQDRI
jgi:hypothetical protein